MQLQAQLDEKTKALDEIKADKQSTEGNTKEVSSNVHMILVLYGLCVCLRVQLQDQITELKASIKQHLDEKEALENTSKEVPA